MKPAGLILFAVLAAWGAEGPKFDITDARGKKPAGVVVEAGAADADGWFPLSVVKGKGDPAIVWPFDGMAKLPDGPEPIPVIVIQRNDVMASTNPHVLAAMATPLVLKMSTAGTGFEATAFLRLVSSSDAFEKGVGLMIEKKPAEAAPLLAQALRERQRQLTRIPSEIYPAAILYGQALMGAKKFDEAAVAFLTAIKQRPSDSLARRLRREALIQAGKTDALEPEK